MSRDNYTISVIFSSADGSLPVQMPSTIRNDTSFEKEKHKVRTVFGEYLKRKKFNEHLRVELWLHRANGISELQYHHGTEEMFRD